MNHSMLPGSLNLVHSNPGRPERAEADDQIAADWSSAPIPLPPQPCDAEPRER